APPLWNRTARIVVGACSAGGVALMVAGWVRTSGAGAVDAQIPWLDLAVSGLLLAGLGNVLWLSAGRRSVADLRVALLPAGFGLAAGADRADDAGPRQRRNEPVAADGMTRYHRADCLLAAGKPAVAASRPAHEAAGRAPCGTCRP
ncbi:MAG TPA: hypothetical protein VHL53_06255, partial [Acidimicrobiia bacterium]|nr:hypothetical protein [Acidimicrobiia bacterium]